MEHEGYKDQEIAETLGVSLKTVQRFKTYDSTGKVERHFHSMIENEALRSRILQLINEGNHVYAIYRALNQEGLHIARSTVDTYVKKIAEEEGVQVCKMRKGPPMKERQADQAEKNHVIIINRKEVMEYLWSGKPIKKLESMDVLYAQYPTIFILKTCISEFRNIFHEQNLPYLYLFIEKYKTSQIVALKSFANGLEKDISAVENAVSSNFSNGPIEGTNNKIKTKKRCMYGRCGIRLLRAKLMYNISG